MGIKILHIIPSAGGIADYAQVVATLYRGLKDVEYRQLEFDDSTSPQEILSSIKEYEDYYIHFEIGSNQSGFYQASRDLARRRIDHLVTIHDTQIVIAHPSSWELAPGRTPGLIAKKIARRAADTVLRRTQLKRWLASSAVKLIVLRKGALPGAEYLPQATYKASRPRSRTSQSHKPFRYGFAGYWSHDKGLDMLLDAFVSLTESEPLNDELRIYGGGFSGSDSFIANFTVRAGQHSQVILLGAIPGPELMKTLGSLDVLVLPYQLSNPAGASAIAMRAAELGVPIIASKAPQLTELLGSDGVYFEPAHNVEALAGVMQKVRNDYATYVDRAQRLQDTIFEQRSHAQVQKRLAAILTKLK